MTATNLVLRENTLLGVCEGLGEELGFNADYLRVVLAAALLWNPAAVVGLYLALGVVLAVARWAWPVRGADDTATAMPAPPTADNDAPTALAQAA